jgi:hypothetical protein
LFEANGSLTYQEAASSINYNKEGLCDVANKEKRSLTTSGLIEVLKRLTQKKKEAKMTLSGMETGDFICQG